MTTFKAYLVTPRTGPRQWDTVEFMAAALARKTGGTMDEVEVPAAALDLIPFLNALEARLPPGVPIDAEITVAVECGPVMAMIAPEPTPDAGAVCGRIMDTADHGQIERIFGALGCRFGELARGVR